jgi:hypothetical protein
VATARAITFTIGLLVPAHGDRPGNIVSTTLESNAPGNHNNKVAKWFLLSDNLISL